MNLAWYILWFIVALGLLVIVHEFGHYWVAKRLGFKVLRFSVGFGKPLYRRVWGRDGTEFVVSALPLGGYVKFLDEREGPVPPQDLARSFTRRPHWQRILVMFAGPAFNFAFAVLVQWGMFWWNGITTVKPVVGDVVQGSIAAEAGLRTGDVILAVNGKPVSDPRDVLFGLLDGVSGDGDVVLTVRTEGEQARRAAFVIDDPAERRRLTEGTTLFTGLGFQFWRPTLPPVLGEVMPDGPAAAAGLQTGDRIVAIDGMPVTSFAELSERIGAQPNESIVVRYLRDGTERNVRLTTTSAEVDGKTVGRIQVAQPTGITWPESMMTRIELSPVAALGRAGEEVWNMTVLQARIVWRMLFGQVSLKNLSGPLSIAEFAGESAQAGVTAFLSFLVLISLSLGFLNLLPIPILDGGQIVFQVVEWVKGSPLSDRAQIFGQQVGLALLILLMGLALFNDIARQFG